VIKFKIQPFATTVVGSFPLNDSIQNRIRCVEDQIAAGIDFPSFPQLVDMGEQFLDDLVKQKSGIVKKDKRYVLSGKRIYGVNEPPGLELINWAVEYIKSKGLQNKVNLKGCITGPFTLASYVNIGKGSFPFNTALTVKENVSQIADILIESCKALNGKVNLISIDEPILSIIAGSKKIVAYKGEEQDIIEIYERLKKACGHSYVGTHICGRISPTLKKILLNTSLDYLNHEFHDSPSNFEIYSREELEAANKMLAVGCVSSVNSKVETVEEIKQIIGKARRLGENLIFTPDCGFRNLIVNGSKEAGYELSVRKIENMVKAVRRAFK
jgi:methionine synthase II (cobalamin-independent)